VQKIRPERVDLGKWWLGSEQTGERMGLIVCGDPSVTAKMISVDCEGSDANTRERIAEMIRFAASEDHFRVRRELGIVIGV
jgi:hypothetical protein